MTTPGTHRPTVLCLSGHDPTGGAGLQADIEALAAVGCRACTVVTALTAQNTTDVRAVLPQDPENFLTQARTLIQDMPIAAVKIGLLGSAAIAYAVAALLDELEPLPVVLDPVLAAGGGAELARQELVGAIRTELLPRATLATPNLPEACRLGGSGDETENAAALLKLGCPNILLTGTHALTDDVLNRLHSADGTTDYRWPRLPYSYHGSGCTLAAAAAGYLALGHTLASAVELAQRYAWRSLRQGSRPGKGQHLPRR